MSRVGKQVITLPEKTELTVADGVVRVKGPGGELSRAFPRETVGIVQSGGSVSVSLLDETQGAARGTLVAHLKNMLAGVREPFTRRLIIEGIGYRAEASGGMVTLALGFSHPVKVPVPKGITVTVEKNALTIAGADKEGVGQFAAKLRALKKPEPYKGKGIRYDGEVIRRKLGKRSTTA